MPTYFSVEAPAGVLFAIFYLLFCAGFVLQFREFSGAGLSPENLLGSLIACSEDVTLVEFHLRKTAFTLVAHALLPLGALVGYAYFSSHLDRHYASVMAFFAANPMALSALSLAIAVPISTAALVYFWSLDNWSKHPFVQRLMPYATGGQWRHVAGDINTEFRRIDKFTIHTSPISKVVVTDNWVVLFGQWPWQFRLAHQSDVTTSIVASDQHNISTEGHLGGTQYLNIKVNNRRPGAESFVFRLNALEYQNLQDKLKEPIRNASNVQIYKTVSERFVEVFRAEVLLNPPAEREPDVEPCIGCMVQTANVRLVRRCGDDDTQAGGGGGGQRAQASNRCVNCYCRPMWCVDCMAKWFASRQNQQEPETWLGSKCPCPTCRSKFCVLDVSIIPTNSAQSAENDAGQEEGAPR